MHDTVIHHPLLQILSQHSEYVRLREALTQGEGPVSVFGVGEASKGHLAAALFADAKRALVFVTPSEAAAAKLADEIACYVPCAHFPARDIPLTGDFVSSDGLEARRVAILSAAQEEPVAITASIEAMLQRLAPPQTLRQAVRTLHVGDVIEPRALLAEFLAAGYERVDACESRRQVSQRGGYVDIFPITAENPVRIEFFDDEIDTMRSYDALTQRSIENVDSVSVPPAAEMPITAEARARAMAAMQGRPVCAEAYEALRAGGVPSCAVRLLPLFYPEEYTLQDYFKDALFLLDDMSRIEESAHLLHAQFAEAVSALVAAGDIPGEQAASLCAPLAVIQRLGTPRTALFFAFTRSYGLIAPKALFRFETRPVSRYVGDETLLREDLALWRKNGATVLLYAGAHAQRLQDRLRDMDALVPVTPALERPIVRGEQIIIGETLERGYEYSELGLVVISENELYGDVPRKRAKSHRSRPQMAFTDLAVGDLVVHELHGIGRFVGVVTLMVDGAARDYLHLVYSGGDKLYIPTDQLDRVQKYIGGEDGGLARLSKLGSGEWQRAVARTREGAKKLAFDLVQLYGERQKRKGFCFAEDNAWQQRLEESFPYEETADQLTSIEEIKRDMCSGRVMDRLLCGDVGYGKTEVALRAAFKAVLSGKQVAMLVPTTILAQQHYNTIVSRFSGFPVNVALLSRFKTPKEQQEILQGLKQGRIDFVVGTHKLLGKAVQFKDLGLLIVDEEQRFGVAHKEQIKNIKRSVDVLTLSATPIPRTLHMSMTGIRDMSVIETPPAQRYPVQTYVMEYADGLVREAIRKEIGRGGQVYFVYNHVRTMEHFATYLRELVPEARIAFAHGQMGERALEKTMLDFLDKQFDVLLCSTIIESGLDITNVNTMFVYDADQMGLSQLYQLRGRVGRGVRLGYAYMFFRRNKVLSEVAERRLSAIRELTQFGSGFRIAMRDLEIRGAGNLLGPEQSGHMEAVGYDLYCKIVDSAVREAKGEPVRREIDTVMELPLPASLPHEYVPRESDRLAMYKRIAAITAQQDIYDVQDELIDRFGDIPKQVQNLLFISLLKANARRAFVTRISVKEGEAVLSLDVEAPINGAKLFDAAQSIEGAQLRMGETPRLIIRRPRQTAQALCFDMPQIVYTLNDCITPSA
ncbi:MAG: transcription-repair coupling factor [Christensenellaceae bacterium]|jgi:transcription-repair coupling factor (superfamily II helicase)|nr:transcription-repair coupling factor [Christensenellaceae bacterium]